MKLVHVLIFILLLLDVSYSNAVTPQDISSIRWNRDGSMLAIGYYDSSFKVVQSVDMAVLFTQPGSGGFIKSFGWSHDNTKLAIGYYYGVDIWDIVSFQKLSTINTGSSANLHLNWGQNDTTLFVGDGGDVPTLEIDINSNTIINAYTPSYSRIDISNASSVAISNNSSEVIFIDLPDMSRINSAYFGGIGQIAITRASPNRDIVAIGFVNNMVRILDVQSLQVVAELNGMSEVEIDLGERPGIVDLAFNETGSRLFTMTRTGTIRSWDTSTWQMISSIELVSLTFIADFSPNGSQVTYAEWEQGPQIFMRDLCDFVAPDVTTLLNIMPQANTFGEEAQICLTENATYILSASLPDITGDITLIGNGAQIVMTGGNRIFNVTATGSLHLKNVILSGGVADDGGAIFNAGDLTLENVILENHSAVRGGAIYNTGNLVMNGGAIQNNSASEFGGGIYNIGDMQLDGVNIRENNAPEGSGVYQE